MTELRTPRTLTISHLEQYQVLKASLLFRKRAIKADERISKNPAMELEIIDNLINEIEYGPIT